MSNKEITQPSAGSASWNNPLNTNFGNIDSAFGGYTVINPTGVSGNVTLTSTQYIPPILYIGTSQTGTATLTANVTYKFPSGVGGVWTVYNNTTGAYTISFATTSGSSNTIQIPQGFTVTIISDGTYVGFATTVPTSFSATSGQIFYASSTAAAGVPAQIVSAAKLYYDNATQALRIYGATSGYSGFKSAATTTSVTYTLPSADGSSGQVLSTNGSGGLSWSSPSAISYPASGIAVSTGSGWGTSLIAPTGAIVGTTDAQTLTNKTMSGMVNGSSVKDSGGTSYSIGYLQIPQSSSTTPSATDVGKHLYVNSTVTINASVFSAGDSFVIINSGSSTITITQGSSVTLRLAGSATTGSRTLTGYGMASILCVVGGATPTFMVTGSGVS